MKKEYLKHVKKGLSVSKKAKKEILQDLNEIFDSAMEHGETEEQVICRLGDPNEYAKACSFKSTNHSHMNKKQTLICSMLMICAFLCFTAVIIVQSNQIPKGIIGEGTSLTNIVITDHFPIDSSLLYLILGLLFVFLFILFLVKVNLSKKKTSDSNE